MNLLELLKKDTRTRERSNKNRTLAYLIRKNYNIEIDNGKMADIVGEILTRDREWRKILKENPELRGSDYSDKDMLEQEKMLELGYGTNPNTKEFESKIMEGNKSVNQTNLW